jgi:tRNA1Val (adenine37-N6)-methyltransferase
MGRDYFQFKMFTVHQAQCSMKVTLDACIFGSWITIQPNDTVLDIGTGSGLLALMAAQKGAQHIDAIDICAEAAKQAKHNFERSPWSAKLYSHHISLTDFCPQSRYHTIICNPPFYLDNSSSPDERRSLSRDGKHLDCDLLLTSLGRLLEPERGRAFILSSRTYGIRFCERAERYDLFLQRKATLAHSASRAPHCQLLEFATRVPCGEVATEELHSYHEGSRAYGPDVSRLLQPFILRL